MKQSPTAASLLEKLEKAANTPLQIPNQPKAVENVPAPATPAHEPEVKLKTKVKKEASEKAAKEADDRHPISLRPSKALLQSYVDAALERGSREGKLISAQQLMIEVLEKGIKTLS